MRPRSVAILAVIFVLLLAMVILDRGPAASSSGEVQPVVSARPSQIMRLACSNGADSTVLESGALGWTIRRGETVWVADDRRVTAGLRLLTSAVAEPAESGPVQDSIKCKVESETGTTTITIARDGLSGSRAATIDGRQVRIDSAIASLLLPDALFAWADPVALPGFDSSTTDIRIATPSGATELARIGTRWGIINPVRTPADTRRVAAMIGAMAAVHITHTTDSPAMGKAVFTVAAASPGRDWSLSIDEAGRGMSSVSIGESTLTTWFTIDAESRAAFEIDHTSLLAPVVLAIPASDIMRLEVVASDGESMAVLEREGRTWNRDAEAAEAVLALLTATEAQQTEIVKAARSAYIVAVHRFGNLPVADLSVWRAGETLFVHDGQVTRSYMISSDAEPAAAAATVAAWLADVSRTEPSGSGD